MKRLTTVAALLALGILAAPAAANSTSGLLRAGAGQADITPPQLGYYLGGWTRADRVATGQSTRLYANALVLQRGTTKVALVAAELFAVPAGMQEDVARKVADLGYTKQTIVLQASHTHSGPGGYFNDKTYNTAAPSVETVTNPISYYELLEPKPADPQLYTFLVNQIAAAIRRADGDRALASAGWGHTELAGVTQNRSIEAHLADRGIHVAYGQGTVAMDPLGYIDTIDPNVDVLRVDKLVLDKRGKGRHHVPIGAYSEFADHGTVVKSDTEAYSGDHHATAWRDFVDRVRKSAHVPNNQAIVDVYPNSDEGDITAGIQHTGIEGAIQVGSAESKAMFAAWKEARAHLSQKPDLDLRWTRTCFCGRMTATGAVDSSAEVGIGFLTGSEEGRGPLYDVTHVPFEGVTSPIDSLTDPAQGNKIGIPESLPPAVPITVVRIGDGAIATVPGEPTKETGTRIRQAVLDAMAGSGVTHAVIAGLANDYISYVATPEEYETQSYEGASTVYGKNESTFFEEQLADLARDLVQGKPAPHPYPFDPSYGIHPDGAPYPPGADHATITQQPAPTAVARGADVTMAWTGGPSGLDRPVDRAFIRAERLVGHRWRIDDTDLGLGMLWRVDDQGHYTLQWTPVKTLPAGTYRMHVTATRYELISSTFTVTP
jgi:hypothetical protein